MNIYEPLDLGAFSPDLAGQTLNVLRNPTRGMRIKFLPSTGQEFLDCVAEILNVKPDEVNAIFDGYDAALFQWLFVPVAGDSGLILPYVYELWDAYADETIKKLRSASSRRVISGNRPSASQNT